MAYGRQAGRYDEAKEGVECTSEEAWDMVMCIHLLLVPTCLQSTETWLMSPGPSKAGMLGKGQSLATQAGSK